MCNEKNETKLGSLLSNTFTEVHQHLRATDDKRDRLANLYMILIAAFASIVVAFLTLENTDNYQLLILIGTFFFVIFIEYFGHVIISAEINSRKWHTEYMNCSIILQNISAGVTPTVNIKQLVKFDFEKDSTRSLKFTIAVMILNKFIGLGILILIIIALDLHALAYFIVSIITLLLIFHQAQYTKINATEYLKAAEEKFKKNPFNNWMLRGLSHYSDQDGETD